MDLKSKLTQILEIVGRTEANSRKLGAEIGDLFVRYMEANKDRDSAEVMCEICAAAMCTSVTMTALSKLPVSQAASLYIDGIDAANNSELKEALGDKFAEAYKEFSKQLDKSELKNDNWSIVEAVKKEVIN